MSILAHELIRRSDILPGPIRNGINGFGQVFVLAAAYYVGTEIVSVAAGESKNPQRDVPRVRASPKSVTFKVNLMLTLFRPPILSSIVSWSCLLACRFSKA